jgi:hypothetical protein
VDLDRHGREFYRLTITTNPPSQPEDWEASFDRGATWVSVTVVDGAPAWLVEGPDAPQPPEGAVLTGNVYPLIRLVTQPEYVVRSAPRIRVT